MATTNKDASKIPTISPASPTTPSPPSPSTQNTITPTSRTSSIPPLSTNIVTTATTNITAYATALGTSITDALASAVSDPLRLPARESSVKKYMGARQASPEALERHGLPGEPGNPDETTEVSEATTETGAGDVGIVTVVAAQSNDEDPKDMQFLYKIPRFEPLLKSSIDTSFNWSTLFTPPTYSSKRRDAPHTLDPIPFEGILQRIRKHSKTCIDAVLTDQKLLIERVNSMDEYCAKLANTMSGRVYQAKPHVDALTKLSSITKSAETTKSLLIGIVKALDKLDAFLAPGERLDNLENKQRYPAIVKIRNKLSPNFATSPVTSPHSSSVR
ncbi:hypothetical protein HDU97_000326 [Phlyctochytrium planicorne]|nr:hypothetical protein HDU97_000326 [Phlyctochytrium planicorne]